MQCRNVVLALTGGLMLAATAMAQPQVTTADNGPVVSAQHSECAARCAELGKTETASCVKAGGNRRECTAQGRDAAAECREDCRGGKTCESRCQRRAAHIRRRCLADGGDQDRCNQIAREALEECLHEHCQPPRPPTCEEECEDKAMEEYRMCLATDASPDDCAMRARAFLRHCIDENCTPAGCEDRCKHESKVVLRICLEAGGSEGLCHQIARTLYDYCVEQNCPTCEETCARRALGHYRECVEGGDDPDDCAHRARLWYADCVDDKCTIDRPCRERCRHYAAGVRRLCLDMGGSEEDCHARATEAFEQCVAGCPAPCGGIAGIPCEAGEYCMYPPGTCNIADNMGVCRQVPEACFNLWEPVCGCDGQTYSNNCFAAMAKVSIAHPGPCDRPNACGPNLPPCGDEQFCQFTEGTCGPTSAQPGHCTDVPEVCPRHFDPVCGCDGKTYGNRCEAAMAGQSVKHHGPCETDRCGGLAGLQCDSDREFCKYPVGTCACCDIFGKCTEIPNACPDHVDPVCGCDGATYFNRCEADAAGVSVLHPGECKTPCDGNDNCRNTHYCQKPPGHCDAAVPGVCEPRPINCTEQYDPVCGCDGKTYDNACFAAAAGVSISHEGACED